MSAVLSRSLADYTSAELRSIDELDAAIGRLAKRINSECYHLLLLVRELDDRFAWKKWSFKCCADWLAWRTGISPLAAREKVRTAQALRALPAISAAFAEGRLSYSQSQQALIPRGGYRLKDFVDDGIDAAGDGADQNPSREGFCTTAVHGDFERSEVRETRGVYRI